MIVFGFSRPKSKWAIGSWLIRRVQRTNYSHTYIKWHDCKTDQWIIYQATGKGGVNFISEGRFASHNVIIKEFAVREDKTERIAVYKFCEKNAGDDYGYLQLLGIGWAKFVKWLGGRVDNPFPHGQVCCEVVAKLLANNFAIQMDWSDMDVIDVKYVHDKLQYAVDNRLQGGRWSVFFDLVEALGRWKDE